MRKRFLRVKYGVALAAFALSVAASGYLIGQRKEQKLMPIPTPLPTLTAPNAFLSPTARAMNAGDYEAALTQYRRAVKGCRTDAECYALADKLHDLGQSAHYRDVGRGALALSALSSALSVYKRDTGIAHTEATVATLCDYAQALLLQGRVREADTAFRDAIARCDVAKARPGLTANTLFQYGDFLVSTGNYDAGRKYLQRSRAMRVPIDPGGVAQCEWMLGVADSDQGRYESAIQHLTDAANRFTAANDRESRAAVYGSRGDVAFRQGDFETADAFYAKGLARWREIKQPFWTGVFLARQARVRLATGDIDGAETLARESLDTLSESNGAMVRAGGLQVLGEVATRRGDFQSAESLLNEALALRLQRGHKYAETEVRDALTRLYTATNGISNAEREARAAQNLRRAHDFPVER